MSGLANSAASDGNWYYYTDDKIDTSFTGLAQNKSGWFYVEKGKVNFSFTGFAQNGKNWFWVEKGYVDQEHAGLYNDSAHGWWYVYNSQVDFSACKFVQNDQGWFWVDHGQVDFKHTGLYHDSSHGWWYAKNSKIDMTASKFVQYGKDWFWVDKGQVDLKHAGLYHDSAHGWWYVYNSKIDMSACKFVQNDQGWWWVDHGQVDMKHTGLYHDDTHGWWSVVNSIATIKQVPSSTFGLNNISFKKDDNNETYYATWEFIGNGLDSYQVKWSYKTKNTAGRYIEGSSSTIDPDSKAVSSYAPPSDAIGIRFRLQPIAEAKTVNNVSVSCWTYEPYVKTIDFSNTVTKPTKADTPKVEVDSVNSIKATINSIAATKDVVTYVRFRLYRINRYFRGGSWEGDETSTCITYKDVKVPTDYVKDEKFYLSTKFDITKENEKYTWKITAAYINENSAGQRAIGEESDFSETVGIGTTTVYDVKCKALSSTSVQLTWGFYANSSPDNWEILYATKEEYMNESNNAKQTLTVPSDEALMGYTVTGLETGNTYYFMIRPIKNSIKGFWGQISSVILGKPPSMPTTWSSTTTAMVGDSITLYWVHNPKDNSAQTKAQVNIWYDQQLQTRNFLISNVSDDDELNKTNSYAITVPKCSTIKWQVRTAGATGEYGDWSVTRVISVYEPVTLNLDILDKNGGVLENITKYPFYISAKALPKSQHPLSYHVSIIAKEAYETTDVDGEKKYINAGEAVYSKYFDTTEDLLVEITPGVVTLTGKYSVECIVSMNSGLTKKETRFISVSKPELTYAIDMEIGLNTDDYSTYLKPYAQTRIEETNEIHNVSGLEFAVYRREYDGTFTKIASGLKSEQNIYVPDPHPSLDYARYRVVATDTGTGALNYADIPPYPIDCPYIIIQWNETWSSFIGESENAFTVPVSNGSMLKLPFNIDTTEENSPDVELVEYVGRRNPVSYYGTQMGETGSWNTVIDANDSETLYALRRLKKWMGNVYVREPSGIGYWANVKVSISRTHCEVTIPISLNITRVEGEM